MLGLDGVDGSPDTTGGLTEAGDSRVPEGMVELLPNDSGIVELTDTNGVNKLIGRKIETPADWLEVREERLEG